MYSERFILLILCCLALFRAQAQRQAAGPEIAALIEQIMEGLPEDEAEQYDFTELYDLLHSRLRHPLDLNKAGAEDLRALRLLSELQVTALLEHIRETGPLADLLELQSVRNFDLATIRGLLPFVRVGTGPEAAYFVGKGMLKSPEQELILHYSRVLNRQKGYVAEGPSRMPGDPGRWYVRYRLRDGNRLRLHLTAEKDPGEPFPGTGKPGGFDFYSGGLYLRGNGFMKKLLVGDYLLQFGQGLALWNGFSLGKGPAVLNIARQGTGVKPHQGSGESYFFRGLAGSFSMGKIEVSPFISRRMLDGTETDINGQVFVSSIRRSGMHRTQGERDARHSLRELLAGSHLRYRFSETFSVGATFCRMSFDKPLAPGDEPYQLYRFHGEELTLFSVDYAFGKSNYYLFGETARSLSGGWAFVNGLLVSLTSHLSVSAAYRNYQNDYHALYYSPLSEASAPAGERGSYLGVSIRFPPAWEISAYADAFSYSWLRYRVDAPSEGYELSARLAFRPEKHLTFYTRYRRTVKARNVRIEGSPSNSVADGNHTNLRFHAEYRLNRHLRLSNRAEFTLYQLGGSRKTGFGAYQNFDWDPGRGKIGLDVRFTFFRTDDYDTRLYAYENSLPQASGLAMYYDRGFRTYLSLRWKINRHTDLRVRYGLLRYAHRESIGSGPEEIAGNSKSDIRLQLRLQF